MCWLLNFFFIPCFLHSLCPSRPHVLGLCGGQAATREALPTGPDQHKDTKVSEGRPRWRARDKFPEGHRRPGRKAQMGGGSCVVGCEASVWDGVGVAGPACRGWVQMAVSRARPPYCLPLQLCPLCYLLG